MKLFTNFVSTAIAVSVLFETTFGQLESCPPFHPMVNFSLEDFLGKWYEIGRYTNEYQDDAVCVSLNISHLDVSRRPRFQPPIISSPDDSTASNLVSKSGLTDLRINRRWHPWRYFFRHYGTPSPKT